MKDLSLDHFNVLAALLHPTRGDLFAKSPVKLVGIRGAADPDETPNSFARYDDLILVFIDDTLHSFPASTDPSWALVVHPINPDGAAQLLPGIHLFETHLMHAGTPRAHLCLGQAEDVHLNRLNPDGTVNHVECSQVGICIHSGGDGMDTGRFSAGCQIIQNPDGYFGNPTWTKFFGPIQAAMEAHQLATVPYFLLNASDL